MAEYVNDYVVKVESGHPGYQSYTIICTPDKMREMLDNLGKALDENPTVEFIRQDPKPLWSQYATVANKETSRVYLQFAIDNDLSRYHKLRRDWGCVIATAIGTAVALLAFVGLKALVDGYMPF